VAQSPEFPELKFVRPRSWKAGRARPGQPTLIVIHDTEGSEGRDAAENGAAYDARRTDGVSTHFFVDADSVVQCVLTKDTAHHAKSEGNIRGIGFELCGRASQTQAQWLDGGLDLRLAAKYVAKCCRKWGIPARKLTVAEMRAGKKGICAHADVTAAWHQTDHTDPGRNFPWTQFLAMVQAELNPPEEEDLNADQDARLRRVEGHVVAVANRLHAFMQNRHEARFRVPGERADRVEPNKAGYTIYDTHNILTALASGADEASVHQEDGSSGTLSLAPLYARLAADVDEQAVAAHLAASLQSVVISDEQLARVLRPIVADVLRAGADGASQGG
jgi:N-acetyl-anhydromuramyl-L-alanine amidase AmpD